MSETNDPEIFTPSRRFKRMDELTVGEILESQRTGVGIETDEYRDYRRQVLEDAGIEDEPFAAEKPLEDLTAADHDRNMRERTR